MRRIADALANKQSGLYYGNRVLLPFHGHVLKIIIDNDILTNFSPSSKDAYINETDAYTEIYFLRHDNLKDAVSKHEAIKIIIAEKGTDIFKTENHLKLALRLGENHKLTIEKTDEDILFIE